MEGLRPFAIHDLPASCFPLTIEAYDKDDNLLWSRTANPTPGKRVALEIPGLKQTGAWVTKLVHRYGDGKVEEYHYDHETGEWDPE